MSGRSSYMKPLEVPPSEETLLYNTDWDTMENSLFGSNLDKRLRMVCELCNNVLDMTGDSLCDIQTDSSEGMITEQDNGFACSNVLDKPVHNLGGKYPGSFPQRGVQEAYSNDLGKLMDTLRLDHILQGNVTLLVSAKPLWKQGEYENVRSPPVISSKVHACRLQMEFKVFNLEVFICMKIDSVDIEV